MNRVPRRSPKSNRGAARSGTRDELRDRPADEVGDAQGLGDQRGVRAVDLFDMGEHALRHEPLSLRRDRVALLGDLEPGRNGLSLGRSHPLGIGGDREWPLRDKHHLRQIDGYVRAERLPEPLGTDVEVGAARGTGCVARRRHRSARQQAREQRLLGTRAVLAFIRCEHGHKHEADDIALASGTPRDHGATLGAADQHDGTVDQAASHRRDGSLAVASKSPPRRRARRKESALRAIQAAVDTFLGIVCTAACILAMTGDAEQDGANESAQEHSQASAWPAPSRIRLPHNPHVTEFRGMRHEEVRGLLDEAYAIRVLDGFATARVAVRSLGGKDLLADVSKQAGHRQPSRF